MCVNAELIGKRLIWCLPLIWWLGLDSQTVSPTATVPTAITNVPLTKSNCNTLALPRPGSCDACSQPLQLYTGNGSPTACINLCATASCLCSTANLSVLVHAAASAAYNRNVHICPAQSVLCCLLLLWSQRMSTPTLCLLVSYSISVSIVQLNECPPCPW